LKKKKKVKIQTGFWVVTHCDPKMETAYFSEMSRLHGTTARKSTKF
jgi:hypothetical protein